jgi:hypothetical protein
MTCRSHVNRLFVSLFALIFLFILPVHIVNAGQVKIAWNKVSDPEVTGYKVYHGTKTRSYSDVMDAHTDTTYTFTGLSETGPHFFSVKAYSLTDESNFSTELVCYTIKAPDPANGQILPTGPITLSKGSSQTFSISPDSGYTIADVLVDGSSVGAVSSYTFSKLSACHSISASFIPAASSYALTASVGVGGTISPTGTVRVAGGTEKSFTITPYSSYKIADVKVDGVSVGTPSTYSFTKIASDHTITATFTKIMYKILASVAGSGVISPAGTVTVASGANQAFSFTPGANYKIGGVQVDGVSVGAVTSYNFSGVASDHSIKATFVPITYTIQATANDSGSISPSGSITVQSGTDKRFDIVPVPGYKITNVLVDGTSIGAVSSYSFAGISKNHSIQASFAPLSLVPVTDAGPDQIVTSRATVTLNGANSTDPVSGIATYQWTQTSGPIAVVSNAAAPTCTFAAPIVAAGKCLTFRLYTTNNQGTTTSNTCIVNISGTDQAPLAKAGPNQTVSSGKTVKLEGSGSSDPDNGIANYQWVQTAGHAVDIDSANRAQAAFEAPDVAPGESPPTMEFQLTVTDYTGLQMRDYCLVNLMETGSSPVAAALDKTVYANDTVALDGSGSFDPDGTALAYRWKQLSGIPVTLSDPVTSNPTFTAPELSGGTVNLIFRLIVTNQAGLSASSKCVVTVQSK